MEALNRIVQTADREELVAFKKIGEHEVPVGCFYDEGERYEALLQLLDASIFPLIRRIETRIKDEFNLVPSQLQCNIFGWNKDLKADSIDAAEYQIKKILKQYGERDFGFYVNFDCTKEIDGAFIEWGTQFSLIYGEERWTDEDAEEEFPVWLVYLCGEKTVLETPFCTEQEEAIIKDVITQMQDYYQETYGK